MLYFFYFTTPPIVTFNLSEEIKILVVTFSFPALPLAGPPLVPNCTPSSLLQACFLDTLPLSGSTLTPQKPSPLTGAPLVPTCTPPWQVHPLSPISCSLNILSYASWTNIYTRITDYPNLFNTFFYRLSSLRLDYVVIDNNFHLPLELKKHKNKEISRTHQNTLQIKIQWKI